MGKTFLDVIRNMPMAVNVMGYFMNENVVEIKLPYRIEVVMAEFKGMSAKKDAVAPVDAVTTEGAGPGALLLASAGEYEDGSKVNQMRRRHSPKPVLDLGTLGWLNERWVSRRKGNDSREP